MPTPQPRNRSNRQGNAPRNGGEAETPKPPAPPPAREARPTLERIGDILKREREKRGDDLQQIADYLCIRRIFLEAIENNRYDELPADAYVIGFLRSYAGFLGLDGNEAIDRYRKEMVGRRRRPELTVPTPIAEGRTPSVAIMASAAVAALVIYALWYGLSSSDRTEVSAPPPLPVAAAPEPAPAPTSTLATPPALPMTGAPIALIPAIPPSPATAPATGTTPPAPSASAEAAAAAAPAATTSEAAATNHNFGEGGSDSRITIRAEKESWILIADEKGHTVFDRVLKPGDSYRVPDIDGLTLTAGNGNGIVISVDGQDLPKLAGSSLVLRNVELDPDELMDKTGKSRE